MRPTLLILAAGMGSRYGGAKQIDHLGPNGETIIDYSLYDAIRAGFGKVVFVIRENFAKTFKEAFNNKLKGKIEVEYVYQELDNVPEGITVNPDRTKPWGTGHAVLVARNVIHEPFVVINADDFYGSSGFKLVADYYEKAKDLKTDNYCMVGYGLESVLSDHGHVSRGICKTDGNCLLQSVVEHTQIERLDGRIINRNNDNTKTELTGKELVSMNFWGFTPSFFNYLESYFSDFIMKNSGNPKAEFYIPFVVNEMILKSGLELKILESNDRWFGLTYAEDKDAAIRSINRLIEQGKYPEKLW